MSARSDLIRSDVWTLRALSIAVTNSSDGNDDGGVAHCFFSVHLSTDYSNFPTIKTSVSNSSRHNNSCLREIQLAFDSRQATVAGAEEGVGLVGI